MHAKQYLRMLFATHALKISSKGLHKCTKNHEHMLYCFWDMAHDRCNLYFSFGAIFCPFTPLTCPKNENFKKIKKTPGDMIILHKCTKNHDHMLYCSSDMVRNRFNCHFSFWAIFYPFTSLTAQKNQNLEKMKKTLGDITLQQCTKNHDHMLYCSWDMMHDGCNYFSFWAIFSPFTLLTARKIKKMPGDIIILHMFS